MVEERSEVVYDIGYGFSNPCRYLQEALKGFLKCLGLYNDEHIQKDGGDDVNNGGGRGREVDDSSIIDPTDQPISGTDVEEHNIWKGYVDWKKKPAIKGHHIGILAATIVLVMEVMENLAYLTNASNLMMYFEFLTQHMHFSPEKQLLLALLGGFLS